MALYSVSKERSGVFITVVFLLFINLLLILFCEGRYCGPGLCAKRPLVRLPHGKHFISMQVTISLDPIPPNLLSN